jgi:hypothetical protein
MPGADRCPVVSRSGWCAGFDNSMAGGDICVMPALGGMPRRVAKDGNGKGHRRYLDPETRRRAAHP